MKEIKVPSDSLKSIHKIFMAWSPAKKIVITSILGIFSAIFQSAGGYLPGIGFIISPFSTIPILFTSIISLKHGFLAYILSIFLLTIIEPSELFIFPFTTGLLGLTIGLGFRTFRKDIGIIIFSGVSLLIGICIPLYGIRYPILGPIISNIPKIKNLFVILIFAILYSWLWLKIGLYFLYRIGTILKLNR